MGTSSIYSGPGGKGKLLPDWLDQSNLSDEQKEKLAKEWTAAKASLTRLLNSERNANLAPIINHYFRAYGGSRNFARSASNFIKGFNNVFALVQGFGTVGTKETIKQLGEEFQGKSFEEILFIFSNEFFAAGNDKEASAARAAMANTFDAIIMEVKEHPQLDILDNSILNIILKNFVAEYILIRILTDIGSSYEKSDATPEEINEFETQLRDYLRGCIDSQLKDIDFIKQDKKNLNIENILVSCVERLVAE